MLDITVKARGLDRALRVLQQGENAGFIDRADQQAIGKAVVDDSRRAIREGRTPDGKAWRPTKDGRKAFNASRSLQRSVQFEVISHDTVRISSDDVRAHVAHESRAQGTRWSLSQTAIVPLTREIARRVAARKGWSNIRAFRITMKSGKVLLAERIGEGKGSRLNFLGVFKESLKQYQRRFIGVGDQTKALTKRIEAKIVARFEKGA